jgi:hypothetical protein
MPIDIDLLTESELIDLNHRIVSGERRGVRRRNHQPGVS